MMLRSAKRRTVAVAVAACSRTARLSLLRRHLAQTRPVGAGGYKLVASDLDGTLMRDTGIPPWEQLPSERNQAAIQALLDMGVYFVPISGRMIPCMEPLLRATPGITQNPLSFIGGYNGGLVVGPSDGPGAANRPVLRQETLPAAAVEEAVRFCEQESLLMKIYHAKPDGSTGMSSVGEFLYDHEQAAFFANCGEFPYYPDDSLTQSMLDASTIAALRTCPYFIDRLPAYDAAAIAALRPYKIVCTTNDPDGMMAKVAATATQQDSYDTVRGNFWYEYMPKGINKSTGLQWLAESLGFGLEECVAFGDSSNDFEMVRDAGFGVCMDNGRDEVKAVAAHVSKYNNDEDAVGREIEALIAANAFDV